MLRFPVLLVALAAQLTMEGATRADVVFPARLSISEVSPGLYEVDFTLPVLEGRRLRAEPHLPPTCREVSERAIDASATGFTSRWRVECQPASLAGEAVLIEGLLGTQTELLIEIRTLDGRVLSEILKPSRPGLIVPEPPSLLSLALSSALSGVRRIVTFRELWVLALVMTCIGAGRFSVAWAVLAFATAHSLAQWLAARNLFVVSAHVASAFVLVAAIPPALDLARNEVKSGGRLRSLWPPATLLGLVAGAARPETVPVAGLLQGEQAHAFLFFAMGIALGLALVAATLDELRRVLELVFSRGAVLRIVGYSAGALGVGLVLHRATALFVVSAGLPGAPFEMALLAAVLGALCERSVRLRHGFVGTLPKPEGRRREPGGVDEGRAVSTRQRRPWALLSFASLTALGIAFGLTGRALPLGGFLVAGSLFLFGVLLLTEKRLPWRFAVPASALAITGHAWITGQSLAESVSFPVGTAAGAGVVALAIFYGLGRLEVGVWARVLGAVSVLVAVGLRLDEYARFFDVQVRTEAALGLVRIPLLALLAVAAAALVWPRRRRVLAELGIDRRSGSAHWALLGLAFFSISLGTVPVRNPFFEARAPSGDDARRVMSGVLWNTYHAFNLEDEDELYSRLSENVSGDLVDDLYLDSRRRLEAGTREGAEITVRDVSIVDVDEKVAGTDARSGFSYPCEWIVTARVRHLQHIHHRQNIYKGNITVRIEGDRWKIAAVELTSEDRVVLPWNPT